MRRLQTAGLDAVFKHSTLWMATRVNYALLLHYCLQVMCRVPQCEPPSVSHQQVCYNCRHELQRSYSSLCDQWFVLDALMLRCAEC